MIDVDCALCGDTGEAPLPASNPAFREFVVCGMCGAYDRLHPAPRAKARVVHGFTLLKGGQYHLPVKRRSPK